VRNADFTLERIHNNWTITQVTRSWSFPSVRTGDMVVSIAGRSAAGRGALQLRWLLNQSFDEALGVAVRRHGRKRSVEIYRSTGPPPKIIPGISQIAAATSR